MNLKIEKETAQRVYPQSPRWFQELLEETFGKNAFQKKQFDEIKTYEDACEELGISTEQFFPADDPDEIAYKKLKIIVKAINQGWIPDWDNTNQRKWYPWLNLSSGFGFLHTGYGYGHTHSDVGSRLCFESEEKARYAGNQFTKLYKDFLT
jgi:hypothetical protein